MTVYASHRCLPSLLPASTSLPLSARIPPVLLPVPCDTKNRAHLSGPQTWGTLPSLLRSAASLSRASGAAGFQRCHQGLPACQLVPTLASCRRLPSFHHACWTLTFTLCKNCCSPPGPGWPGGAGCECVCARLVMVTLAWARGRHGQQSGRLELGCGLGVQIGNAARRRAVMNVSTSVVDAGPRPPTWSVKHPASIEGSDPEGRGCSKGEAGRREGVSG